jgi:hypothetical protein
MRFLLVLLALGAAVTPGAAQDKDMRTREQKREGLVRESLAGQNIPIMPFTMVVRDSAVSDSVLLLARPAVMAWADSILADALTLRAPEINWLYGSELARVARRGAGLIPEPAKMGQAILRSEKMKTVPDPTRSNFRILSGLANGRYIFVPAAVRFHRDSTGTVVATLTAVVTDTRSGAIVWRANAIGAGPGAAAALHATVDYFLPEQSTTP